MSRSTLPRLLLPALLLLGSTRDSGALPERGSAEWNRIHDEYLRGDRRIAPGPVFSIDAGERLTGDWVVRCVQEPVRVIHHRIAGGATSMVPALLTPAVLEECEGLDAPAAAVRQLFAAYSLRDADLCAASLSPDFRFTSNDPHFLAAFPEGMDRGGEQRFVEHLANGVTTPDGRVAPRITHVRLRVNSFDVANADGPGARVVARGVLCEMSTDQGPMVIEQSDQTFDLVRADDAAAAPLGGLFATGRWRIRRWEEHVDTTGATPSSAGPVAAAPLERPRRPELAIAAGRPAAFGMRRVSDLRAWPVELELGLPAVEARFELFDVAGRTVMTRTFAPAAGRSMRFAIDAPEIRAGVYYARLRGGDETITRRLIVLR